MTTPRFVLASASPRRADLLTAAGFLFDVDPVHVNEQQLLDESPARYVERVARDKARAGAARHATRLVLGADTVVVVGGEVVLGKPADASEARRMLIQLSGRVHQVLTGVAVAWNGGVRSSVEATDVWFRDLTSDEVRRYVATGEPMDKAGAYAIQGHASRFIPRIDGSYSNVVGLPVESFDQLLRDIGWPPESSPRAPID